MYNTKLLAAAMVVTLSPVTARAVTAIWEPQNNGLSGATIQSLAVGPDSAIYAGTEDGIYQSPIGSPSSWSRSNSPSPTIACSLLKHGGTIYAGLRRDMAFVGSGDGVYLSTDAGQTWSGAGLLNQNTQVNALLAVGTSLYAGTYNGVYRSEDDGVTWTQAGSALADMYISSLICYGDALYAGTYGHGIFVSEDRGSSWTPLNAGFPDPTDSACAFYVYEGTLYVGMYSGVYALTFVPAPPRMGDGSVSWLWGMLALMGACGAGALLLRRKRTAAGRCR